VSIDTILKERAAQNRQAAKAKQEHVRFFRSVYYFRVAFPRDTAWKRSPLKLRCVVCGKEMQAMRPSRKTCSNACRLRLSRWGRLPTTVKRKRTAKLLKQWRRAQWTKRKRSLELAREREQWRKQWRKKHPPRSLAEIEAQIRALRFGV
jgi:hypothetical protein